jgi:peptidoglycan/LPS O-acetylase OafA/YrhL
MYAASLSGLADLARRGDGGVLKSFLSAPVWRVLARLSFGAYCWMILVITVDKAGAYDYPSYSDITMLVNYISCYAVVNFLSYVSYILVEQPCRALEAPLLALLCGAPPPKGRLLDDSSAGLLNEREGGYGAGSLPAPRP